MQFTMKQRGSSNNIVMKSSGTPVDTPTVVRSIVEMLEDPSEHTYDKIKAPPPPAYSQTTILQGGGNGGGTVIINPSVEFVTTDHQVNTDGNIPVVVREAIAASEEALQNTIPVSVVQASSSRKRTMMTRSLSRQASQVEIKEEPEEDTSDEEYIPEPVAKKSRVVFGGQSHSAVTQRVRNAPGRKAKARGDGLDHMEPDERERILQRRRKNKEAAARCRQKRVDLTNTLAGQVEQEQQAKRKLEAEVQKLRLEAARLRRQLDAHRAAGCALEGTAGTAPAPAPSTLSYQLPAGAVAIKSQAVPVAAAPPVIVQAAHGGHFVLSEGQQPQHIASSRPQRPQTLGLSQKQPMSKDKVQIRMEEMDGGYKVETPSRIIGGLAADLFTPTGLFGGLNTPCNETLTSLTAL